MGAFSYKKNGTRNSGEAEANTIFERERLKGLFGKEKR
jgi:hypothetical protein